MKDNERSPKTSQVINLAQGQGGSGGRIDALQDLNNEDISLAGVDVSGAFLSGVNLQGAYLKSADLQGANLWGANLQEAVLTKADLQGALLWEANLQKAVLTKADLQGVDLMRTNLEGAYLERANLQGVKNLTVEQLCTTHTLYKAKGLSPKMLAELKEKYPHLLKRQRDGK